MSPWGHIRGPRLWLPLCSLRSAVWGSLAGTWEGTFQVGTHQMQRWHGHQREQVTNITAPVAPTGVDRLAVTGSTKQSHASTRGAEMPAFSTLGHADTMTSPHPLHARRSVLSGGSGRDPLLPTFKPSTQVMTVCWPASQTPIPHAGSLSYNNQPLPLGPDTQSAHTPPDFMYWDTSPL